MYIYIYKTYLSIFVDDTSCLFDVFLLQDWLHVWLLLADFLMSDSKPQSGRRVLGSLEQTIPINLSTPVGGFGTTNDFWPIWIVIFLRNPEAALKEMVCK